MDVNFIVVPPVEKAKDPALFFWGGYQIDFKVIETARAEELQGQVARLRNEAFVLGESGSSKWKTVSSLSSVYRQITEMFSK